MFTRIILFIVVSLTIYTTHAQSVNGETLIDSHKNAVSFELGGHTAFYSFNYERRLVNTRKSFVTAQVGIAYYGLSLDVVPLWMPITVNYYRKVKGNNYIQLTLGKMLRANEEKIPEKKYLHSVSFDSWVFGLGYRYQKLNSRWTYKAAYTPVILDREGFAGVVSWGAVGIGYRF